MLGDSGCLANVGSCDLQGAPNWAADRNLLLSAIPMCWAAPWFCCSSQEQSLRGRVIKKGQTLCFSVQTFVPVAEAVLFSIIPAIVVYIKLIAILCVSVANRAQSPVLYPAHKSYAWFMNNPFQKTHDLINCDSFRDLLFFQLFGLERC